MLSVSLNNQGGLFMKEINMKRLIAVSLAAIMLVPAAGGLLRSQAERTVFAASAQATPVEQFEYKENQSGGITITGYWGDSDTVVVPDQIGGKNVTRISDYVFSGFDTVTSITLPDTVTAIGENAFSGCTALSELNMPANLKEIGFNALAGCNGLAEISFPASVTYIDPDAFTGCDLLAKINVDSGNETYLSENGVLCGFNGEALICCPAGKTGSVSLSDRIAYIYEHAFYGCSKLTKITVSSNNPTYADASGILMNKAKTKLIACPGGMSGNVSVTSGTTEIAARAFCDNKNITSVTVPSGATAIGEAAFEGCSALSTITLPDSIRNIGYNAFKDTAWLSAQANGVVYAGKTAYTYKGSMPDGTAIEIIDGTLAIADEAFTDMSGISSIKLPESLEAIGDWAFAGCSSIGNINIPGSVSSVGFSAFADCTGLTTAVINEGTTSIEDNAFSGCSALSDLTLPESMESVGSGAFLNCNSLNGAELSEYISEVGEYSFGYLFDPVTDSYEQLPDFTISGFTGTVAEEYAESSGFEFKATGTILTGVKGDVNCDWWTDISDALAVARYDAGLISLSSSLAAVGDVNGDSETDISDALMIARYDAGLISEL